MKILSPLQEDFIKAFAKSKLAKNIFLTGGTALSAFYLFHRFSEDMDFFTELEGEIPQSVPILKDIARELNGRIEIRKEFTTFVEVFFSRKDEKVKIHFAQDTPFRLRKINWDKTYNILIDNLLDIACNKISALFDRSAEKDFVDIYFLSKEFMPFEKIYKFARKKHIGMDEYWLAASLKNVEKIEKLPRMIKPVTIKELREFYYEKIKMLMARIKQKGK